MAYKQIVKKYSSNRLIQILIGVVGIIALVDLTNWDNDLHRWLCILLNTNRSVACHSYYDLPLWEVGAAVGTILAALAAYAAIKQSSKQLEIEQTPHVVLQDHIGTTNDYSAHEMRTRVHTIKVKNVGRGSAIHISVTADPEGEISIIEGSNPHTINLAAKEYNNSWAIDETQVIKGLEKQGISVEGTIIDHFPKEETLAKESIKDAEFKLFIWYEDQLGNAYESVATIRRASHFLKVMETDVTKLRPNRTRKF